MEVEEQSQGNYSNFFSVRIVSIDYYMSPPIPDFDISYSTFQGGGVKEVPIIRIYGSTPASQKACLHVHRALPYLYIPYSEVPVQSIQGIAFENAISLALEKALKLKGHAGSKRQHVHGCTVVRAKKFYGYHSTEELFIKIYLYYPHDVSRAASLLLDSAVFERSVQPYEAHIPFLLQFLIDYNLYGMGHMHLVKMKFRHPVPVDLFRENSEHSIPENGYRSSESQADATAGSGSCPAVWNSSTISDDWMWECPFEPGASSNHVNNSVKRQSICELEGDTTIEDILNQQLKLYTSLSQTCSDVRMVQSLIPIWEEEFERSGVQHADLLGDPGKPPPQDVLTTLSNGTEFQDKLRELYCKAEGCFMTMSEEDVKPITSAQCLLDERIPGRIGTQELNELGSKPSDDTNTVQSKTLHRSALDGVISALSFGEKAVDATNLLPGTETVDSKCADPEDVALLKWLASSQAGEDIDSDDELHRMTILNPVLPSATVDAVLEKANTDYESESQQECQDILDSVVDELHQDEETRKISSTSQDKAPQEVSNTRIPQLDGSGDDQPSTPAANSSVEEMERMTSKRHSVPGSSSVSTKRKRLKMQWGSLPFSESLPVGDGTHSGNAGTKESGKCSDLVKVDSGVHSSLRSTINNSCDLSSKYDDDSCCSVVDSKTLRACSIRDLMRKRRCFRVESSECEKNKVAEICDKEKNTISPRKLDFHLEQSDEQDLQDADDGLLVDNKGKKLDSVKPSSKSSSFCLTASDIVAPNTGSKLCDRRAVLAFEVRKNTASSSSVCLYQFQGKRKLSEDEHDVKCAEDTEICDQPCNQLDLQKPKSMSGTTHHQIAEDDTVKQYASRSQDLGSPYGCLQHERGPGYLSMTFHKKPPIVDWTYGSFEDTMPTATLSYCSVTEDDSDNEERPVRSKSSEDVLPFFGDFHNHYSKQMRDCVDFFQKSSLGIPTHHQNDGSFAYLLTPAISPPSVGSVLNWLSVTDEEKLLKKPLPEFSHRVESSHQSPLKPISSHIDQEKDTNLHIDGDPLRVQAGCSEERKPVKVKQAEHFSQDISQISGPSGQSKPTPLSQIGFKDPASIGAGQQLTLLSIEVQAVSRGDLRPDPHHDAINAIALVFQNDDSASVDIHVLLRGEPKTFGRYVDGQCKVIIHSDEAELLEQFIKIVCSTDPDIVMGWDIQSGSLGYLAERASYLGINLVNRISRTPSEKKAAKRDQDSFVKENSDAVSTDSLISGTSLHDNTLIEDEWGRTHASGVHVSGRIVLNVWRLVRGEVKLNLYTLEAVVEAVLRRKVPYIHSKILNQWFSSGSVQARFRCINYVVERAKLNHEIVDQLDMINRTSELARVFGIDFFSVLSRGSQYRVESMLVRLAHTQNYVLISPGVQQVASQPAMECIPLVMEPESGFYSDPVIVLDFQSLYPSMIIAYNLCYSTCIGNVVPSKADTLGVSSYSQDLRVMKDLKSQTLLTPNGVMYVPSEVRRGVLPQLLKEILSTRIMVKQAMKKLTASQNILHRIFNARQLALKLIANVTYGYTAAGFSGRMPCAELADSIVQCGRRTLEHAISVVNTHNDWNARVIYGDTDSMFVLLKGRSRKEAFRIGSEIASIITAMNPDPVTLKMEKVYQSCFLLSKKRYVGYSYESLNQLEPIFDAKGIETVRRDTCAAVAKTMEKSLRMFFECQDISQVREFLQRQWSRILSGRISIQDFVFAKEVRLGTYSTRTSCLPPAAIVASKAMRVDPRAEPRYAERVPYVVVHGEPGVRLIDMVVDPQELLALESPYRLNDVYYISKQIIPALQRVFGLVGADLNQWFQEMPRHVRDAPTKHYFNAANSLRARIDHYYSSRHCVLCGELARAASRLCEKCFKNGPLTAAVMTGRTAKLERDIQHLAAICRHCGGGDWVVESGVKCTSLACTVYYERVKAQKELRAFSSVATEAGFYPKCMVEWF